MRNAINNALRERNNPIRIVPRRVDGMQFSFCQTGTKMVHDIQKGKVQTVLGIIDPTNIGPVMMHEHLLLDLSFIYDFEAPFAKKSLKMIGNY